jgi:hypothetical protein
MTIESPKSRFRFRFSIRTLLLVITCICIGLAWNMAGSRGHQRQVCEHELDRVLLATHWKAIDSPAGAQALVQMWANDLSSPSNCTTKFLHPTGTFSDGSSPDSYEQQLLADWLKQPAPAPGTPPERVDRTSFMSSTYVDYIAIRAKASCVPCHAQFNAMKAASNRLPLPPPLKVGDLMAIGRVELAK